MRIEFGTLYKNVRFGEVPLPYMLWVIESIQDGLIDSDNYPELREWLRLKRRMIIAKKAVYGSGVLKSLFAKYKEDYDV